MGYPRRLRLRRNCPPIREHPRPLRHPPARLRSPCHKRQTARVRLKRYLIQKALVERQPPRRSLLCRQFHQRCPVLLPKRPRRSLRTAVDLMTRSRHQLQPRRAQLPRPFRMYQRSRVPIKTKPEPPEEKWRIRSMEMWPWPTRPVLVLGRHKASSSLVSLLLRSLMKRQTRNCRNRRNNHLILHPTPHLQHRHPPREKRPPRHSLPWHPKGPKSLNRLHPRRKHPKPSPPFPTPQHQPRPDQRRMLLLPSSQWTWTSHQWRRPTRKTNR